MSQEQDFSNFPQNQPEFSNRAVGFVGLAGAPNVGKSTLVNHLVGQKISIVSDRPQTTRERIFAILTTPELQSIFVDIPGITEARDRLGVHLLGWVAVGLKGCDLVLHLRDARKPANPEEDQVAEMIRAAGKPVWLVWNKIDRLKSRTPPPTPSELPYERTFAISAKNGHGLEPLVSALAERLPRGPLLYDPEQLSDRDLRYLAAELVREKVFRYLGQEIPYGIAAYTEEFDEQREGKVYIRVNIITERANHKKMIIGHNGAMIKKIGQSARDEIEQLMGAPVFLDLWVKVREKWRSKDAELDHLGLRPPKS